MQLVFSWAPKLARKCESKHWFPCGVDGRAYSHLITKFSRMGRLPHFLSYEAPSTRARGARLLVEVTLEKVYYSKLKFTIVNGAVSVTGIFQFTMVNSTLVNFHDYRGKNKDDPSPITIWLPKKIGGYISSLSKLCLFC